MFKGGRGSVLVQPARGMGMQPADRLRLQHGYRKAAAQTGRHRPAGSPVQEAPE